MNPPAASDRSARYRQKEQPLRGAQAKAPATRVERSLRLAPGEGIVHYGQAQVLQNRSVRRRLAQRRDSVLSSSAS